MTTEILQYIQIFFTIVGGGYALYLLKDSNKNKKIEFIFNILEKLTNDKEIKKIIYLVDSGNMKEIEEIKFGGKYEKESDNTLQYLNLLGFMVKNNKINYEDLGPFIYQINRILFNDYIIKYIKWLDSIGVKLEYLCFLKNKN